MKKRKKGRKKRKGLRAFGGLETPRMSPTEREQWRAAEREVNKDQAFADYAGLARGLAEDGIVKEAVYIRFGDVPERGRSGVRDADQYLERGLSVFAGSLTLEGDYIIRIDSNILHWNLIGCCSIEDRPAYFVRGERLRGNRQSRGVSGEPLIKRIRSIEPAPPAAVVAASVPSFALEDWNRRRGAIPGEPEIPAGGLIRTDPEDYEWWKEQAEAGRATL